MVQIDGEAVRVVEIRTGIGWGAGLPDAEVGSEGTGLIRVLEPRICPGADSLIP
ncbi:MAG: hypothetical protein ABSD67_18890 [Terracidiphilus sp.]|jgi:hypothetical protein